MIIAWENANSFKQHMEDMESFRRAHAHLAPREILKQAQEILTPQSRLPPCPSDSPGFLTDAKGNIIVVPIWDVSMPKSTQN